MGLCCEGEQAGGCVWVAHGLAGSRILSLHTAGRSHAHVPWLTAPLSAACPAPAPACALQEAKQLQSALEGKKDLQFQLNRVQEEAAGLTSQLEEAWAAMGRVRRRLARCRALSPACFLCPPLYARRQNWGLLSWPLHTRGSLTTLSFLPCCPCLQTAALELQIAEANEEREKVCCHLAAMLASLAGRSILPCCRNPPHPLTHGPLLPHAAVAATRR